MTGSILGNAVPRLEDPALLRGEATFIDNLSADRAHVVFVRSSVAHARITGIETAEAAAMPGVVAVFTGDELGLDPHQVFVPVAPAFARPPLVRDVVRFVGDPVVAVVGETRAAAVDAAELVVVDYEPLTVIVDPETAFDDDAPVIFPEHGSNLSFSIVDPYDDEFFADADVVVRGRFENQRVAVVPMESNSFAAVPDDPEPGRITVYASTQMPHLIKPTLAGVLGIDPERIRVIAPHVGGGFGGKAGTAPEYSAVAAIARRLGRATTWTETRSENLVALPHSRAQVQYVELGVRNDGTFSALRARIVGDSGGYPGVGTMLPGGTRRMAMGVYAFPKVSVDVACAVTNTTPTGAYRGAGRPEAASMLERIVDMAAVELAMDPAEIRRRNFIAPDQFPFTTHSGVSYDSGDYDVPLTKALEMIGYDDVRAEQAARRAVGDPRLLGIGLSTYVEITAGGGSSEYASVRIDADGGASVTAGTSAHGQGHATSYAMIVEDRLGIPMDMVRFHQSDTDDIPRGGGTGGSRSLQLGGSAVLTASDAVLDKAKSLAANLLEASVDDIVVHDDGRVGVAGVPSTALSWADLAAAAAEATSADAGIDPEVGLYAALDFDQGNATFPFGAHASVVEVDTGTGEISVLRHVAVDDAGTVINPMIVAGQQHGGVYSGIGQALYEHFTYDADGNPQTANLADYLMPSAAEMPSYEVASTETPTPLNPLGAKGIGEAGTVGSTPAVQNAVVDALAHLGVRHIDMPLTPERMWRTLAAAATGTLADSWREPPAIFDQIRASAAAAPAEVGGSTDEELDI